MVFEGGSPKGLTWDFSNVETVSLLTTRIASTYFSIGSFGKNVKNFLNRFGAILSVVAVVVCAFDFKNALVRNSIYN